MPFKINLKSIMLYAACLLCMLLSNYAVRGVPFSLGLFFAMLVCGTNILVTPAIFILSSAIVLDWVLSLIMLFQAVFLTIITFFYRRARKKLKYEAIIYLVIALAPYVLFASSMNSIELFDANPYIVRSVAAAAVLLFCAFSVKAFYSLLYRLYRCRLGAEEIFCIAVVFIVCGVGLFALFGKTVYLIISSFALVFSARLARSPAAIIVALVLSLPPVAAELDYEIISVYIIISTLTLAFCGAGRLAPSLICGGLTAAYIYHIGGFARPIPYIILYSLLLFVACFAPAIARNGAYSKAKRRLLTESVLTDTAIARSQKNVGEKLYRISEVFKEIECAFIALDEEIGDGQARARAFEELKERCCKKCERCKRCERTNVHLGFKKLINAGVVKGKVNLIDLPSEITVNCARPSDVLATLNGILLDYRRYMTEVENAKSGRKLLAEQAHGVSEVMKSCAVDLTRTQNFSGVAEAIKKRLSENGVSCPEIYVSGEVGAEIGAVVCGRVNVDTVCGVISKTAGRKFVLKDKIVYDDEKRCLIFGAPPRLDAVFGVAYSIKAGEKVSGDTHSVIRINDHSFLMALSDGMGSGEYARKVSEAAISLIEAFYRAEIPRDTVLKTINKLLSFNRDERFTCIDVAAVDLNSGRADFVKIGSPAGVIMREGEIKVLESNSLPLGILDNLRPTVCTESLKSGDIIVFMSDGITSAFPSAPDMYEFLQTLKPLNPQTLADAILAAATERMNGKTTDDMTVVCTRLFEN